MAEILLKKYVGKRYKNLPFEVDTLMFKLRFITTSNRGVYLRPHKIYFQKKKSSDSYKILAYLKKIIFTAANVINLKKLKKIKYNFTKNAC